MTYGEYRRTKPRLNILRGWKGNEPQSLTHAAKPTAGAEIKSGMLIVLDATTGYWVKCNATTHAGLVPYFAYSDDTDTDVLSSGLLLGISCLGEFEVQTAYFNADTTWANSDLVVKGNTTPLTGSVDKASDNTSTGETVGVVTRGGVENLAAINSEALKDANGQIKVLNLVTRWRPASV